ncbi:MAG: hypothetical protein V4683_14490 [Bacteroidota bacterium]
MKDFDQNPNQNRMLPGVLLLVAGSALMAYKMGAPLPWWLFSWQSFIICLGIFIGFRSNFQNPSWLIMIIVGSVFLLNDISEAYNYKKFLTPLILLGLGFYFLIKPNRGFKSWKRNRQDNIQNASFSIGDNIESVNIFSGSKKNVISKDFKGGEIVNIMGGTELNLMQANIEGKILLESVNIMGGTKLVMPSNWALHSEVISIFGGVDDKRMLNTDLSLAEKIIILKGVNIFGGIEIKSY